MSKVIIDLINQSEENVNNFLQEVENLKYEKLKQAVIHSFLKLDNVFLADIERVRNSNTDHDRGKHKRYLLNTLAKQMEYLALYKKLLKREYSERLRLADKYSIDRDLVKFGSKNPCRDILIL